MSLDSLGQLSLQLLEDLLLLVAMDQVVSSDFVDELAKATLLLDDVLHFLVYLLACKLDGKVLLKLLLQIQQLRQSLRLPLLKLHRLNSLKVQAILWLLSVDQLLQGRDLLILLLMQSLVVGRQHIITIPYNESLNLHLPDELSR